MKWANYDLYWGRPLKSILAIFNKKQLNFNFNHINSSNKTFTDKSLEDGMKIFDDFNSYLKFFKQKGILIEQDLRKKFIQNKINEIINKKNFKIQQNDKLVDEIVNIVEKPTVIVCNFNNKFLNIPSEILITTMQSHQKYLPTFDKKNNLTNNFFVVSDIKDTKGLVKLGNERVIEARLSDAEFFWEKNKTQNLVKQVDKLKNVNYFKGLGSYFDKIKRMRKLSSLISDDFLISKDKIFIATARARPKNDNTFKIERVAVLPKFRRLKVGSFLINKIIETYLINKKDNLLILHSQVAVEDFYKSLNFISYGNTFYEDGIPHIAMKYKN